MNADQNAPLPLSGADAISLSDPAGDTDRLTLTVLDGTLNFGSAAGLTLAGNGTSSVTASGSLANLNADLSTLTYTPNRGLSAPTRWAISVFDAGRGVTATSQLQRSPYSPGPG